MCKHKMCNVIIQKIDTNLLNTKNQYLKITLSPTIANVLAKNNIYLVNDSITVDSISYADMSKPFNEAVTNFEQYLPAKEKTYFIRYNRAKKHWVFKLLYWHWLKKQRSIGLKEIEAETKENQILFNEIEEMGGCIMTDSSTLKEIPLDFYIEENGINGTPMKIYVYPKKYE